MWQVQLAGYCRLKKIFGGFCMELVQELLDILACPACKGPLQDAGDALICQCCRLKYPIRKGIPILLVEEAETVGKE